MSSKEANKPYQGSANQVKPHQATPDAKVQATIPFSVTLVQYGQHNSRPLSPNDILRLQRTIGNQKVQRLLNEQLGDTNDHTSSDQSLLTIQRDEKTDRRLDDIEKHGRVEAKKREAIEFDQKWQDLFTERISSYTQTVLRITRGFQIAAEGFKEAEMEQAQLDEIQLQLAGTAFAVMLAGFGWAASSGLGILGKSLAITIEKFENPINTVVSGAVNVKSAVAAKDSNSQLGKGPSGTSSPLEYLTTNLAVLAKLTGDIAKARRKRRENRNTMTDEEWKTLDLKKDEADLQRQMDNLDSYPDISQMKSDNEVATILEKHMWATYLKSDKGWGMGTVIEDRFNAIGISKEAGVKLTGHFYSSNSDLWLVNLKIWARNYKETIRK